jgi:3-oxoacyl-[acyl-carrier protein] reductase
MSELFQGKVVFITGGGAGIGRHYAHRFAEEGASIVVADLDLAAADQLVKDLGELGTKALAVELDVADTVAVGRAVTLAAERFNGIDVLVNNAGVHLGHAQLPYELEAMDAWRHVFDVNVIGALACAVACRPAMIGREGPSIINHSTMAAYTGSGAYGSSKQALNSLTVSLAGVFGSDGIRVNGIAPGLVDSESAVAYMSAPERTGMSDMLVASQAIQRPGHMSDLADAALFLASPAASFITGQTILVDGGATKRI